MLHVPPASHTRGGAIPPEVLASVETLLRWVGEVPAREGLMETPGRVARAWKDYYQGYAEDPAVHLSRTFKEVGGYDEIVLLRDIPFQSHCEHHMAPIIGKASIAHLPRNRVVGIAKLARVLSGYARRLQVQERRGAEGRPMHLGQSPAARRRRDDRRPAWLHDRTRRADARRRHGHKPAPWLLPRRPAEPQGSARADGLLMRGSMISSDLASLTRRREARTGIPCGAVSRRTPGGSAPT